MDHHAAQVPPRRRQPDEHIHKRGIGNCFDDEWRVRMTQPPSLTQPSAITHPIDARLALIVTLALTVTGTIIFKVLPLVVGAAAETFQIDYHQQGMLASSDLLGIAIASITSPLWVRRFNWRKSAMAALLLVVSGNLLSAAVDDLSRLLLIRVITGLGEGAATGLGLIILGDTRNPDRAFGLAMAAPILLGLIGFQVLPGVISTSGFDGLVTVFALVSFVILISLRWLPESGRPRTTIDHHNQSSDKLAVFTALAGTAAYHLALGAVWTFVERIGHSAGLQSDFIASTLGKAVVCGLIGALLATALGIRWGRSIPILIALTIQLTALFLLADQFSATTFIVATCLFQLSWLFSGPFQLGIIASADLSGRFFTLTIAFQAAGITSGPLLAGLLIKEYGFTSVLILAATSMVIGVLLLALVAIRYRTPHRS